METIACNITSPIKMVNNADTNEGTVLCQPKETGIYCELNFPVWASPVFMF